MTFTYTNPSASNKDAVRFLIQDITSTEALLQDEEIDYAIAKWMPVHGSLEWVSASLADTISGRYAREASYSADGVSIGLGQLAQQFRDLAASLRAQHKGLLVGGIPDVGGISPYEELYPGIKNFVFGTGMHDHREGGSQDYGNQHPYYVPENEPGV